MRMEGPCPAQPILLGRQTPSESQETKGQKPRRPGKKMQHSLCLPFAPHPSEPRANQVLSSGFVWFWYHWTRPSPPDRPVRACCIFCSFPQKRTVVVAARGERASELHNESPREERKRCLGRAPTAEQLGSVGREGQGWAASQSPLPKR